MTGFKNFCSLLPSNIVPAKKIGANKDEADAKEKEKPKKGIVLRVMDAKAAQNLGQSTNHVPHDIILHQSDVT